MRDQAQNLRKVMEHNKEDIKRHTKVISVISGKGGVGKSNISLNFSLSLAEQGKKVLLFDLDIGMANLDILMGLMPSSHVVDVIEHDRSIWDIMEEGPCGIQLIAGGSGLTKVFEMTAAKQDRFSQQMALLDGCFDFIVFDMGAGASEDGLNFILASNETIIITTPEPTSITDAYAMLKYIHSKDPFLTSSILVNRTESNIEGKQTAENLQRVARRFLEKELSILGSVPYDKHVLKAVKQQSPFRLKYPASPAAKAIKACANSFIGKENLPEKKPAFRQFLTQMKGFLKRGPKND
ncbi:MinD/ParA family protein [Alteribacillus sp. YIM 98480]|uniref:MinD/ParA family protein n=1 Tax=Alteribacillus sp. YIM 98480 TaxID=2606599 RepID=UPI00131AAEAA|nr:MinD/ParA family protein [Alteribacillus sp. YIM 98480]